jgi:hypothetical protein
MGLKFNPFIGNFDFTGSGASVAGSNTQVQFNDGGVLGADSNFVWDKSNDALGVQVTPLNPIHVAAISGATINNVTVGSVSQTAEVAAPSVTGSVTAIAEFAAAASPSATQNTSGTGYSASGQTIGYEIYGVIYNGATYYVSANAATVSFTDTLNDASSFSVNLSWTAITNATHYLVKKQINGGGFNDSIYTATSSYEDSGWSGSEGPSAWPTEYTLATNATPFTGGSAQAVNTGAGGIFEVSTTILMEVDSVKNINGTDYVSGTPTNGSFNDTGLGQYDAEISWTDNGGATNAIVRISTDGGSTWSYQFVGGTTGPYTFTSISNDSAAQTVWAAGAFTGSTVYTFDVYGKALSPSSQIYYTSTANTYNATISVAGNYIFLHTFSGMGAQGAKILYPSGAATVGQDVTGDFYDIGSSTWVSGLTVTPNSYGYSGTNQVREYKIYSLATIYGNTPLTISTSNTGGSKYNTLTWTLPSGVTQVKITRGINGGAHTVSKTVSGTTTTDDATDSGWSGNTTVTPTSIVPGTLRVDRVTTSLTDSALFKPHIEIVNTHTTGDRSAVLSFGVASGSNGSSTFQSHIYHSSSTSYLNIATTRLRLVNSLGASTFTVQLGDTNEFNMLNGSSNHFTIRSQSNNTLFSTRSDRDTVYIGYNGSVPGIDNAASLDIGRRAGNDHNIYIETGSTANSGDAIKIAAGGSFIGGINAASRMYLNASVASSTTWLLIGGTSSGSQLRLGSGGSGTGTTEGDIWNDNTNKTLACFVNGIKQFLNGNLFAQTTTGTIANSVTETTISSTGQGTLTLPANFFVAGKTIRIRANGIMSSISSPTLRIRIKAGSTTLLDTTAVSVGNHTNALWMVDSIITCRTTGGSGTVFAQGIFEEYGTTKNQHSMVNTTTTTLSTTSSQAMTLTAQWGTASASNTISCTNLTMEILV